MKAEQNPSDELLDVTDMLGNPIGRVASKAVIHAGELWHRDVHVWLTDGRGNLLQQQRAHHKLILPGAWDVSASGHVAAGEDYRLTAERETYEELGLRYRPEQFVMIGRLSVSLMQGTGSGSWLHQTVGEHFVVVDEALSKRTLHLQPEEVAAVRLYPVDQLEIDLADAATAGRHAPHPLAVWRLGIAGLRACT